MQRARFLEVTLGSLMHTGLICKGLFTSKSYLVLSISIRTRLYEWYRGYSVPGCGGLFFIWFV